MQLRQSLVLGEKKTNDTSSAKHTEDNGYDEDNGYESEDPDVGPSYFDMPDKTFDHDDVPPYQEKVWLI